MHLCFGGCGTHTSSAYGWCDDCRLRVTRKTTRAQGAPLCDDVLSDLWGAQRAADESKVEAA